MTNGMAGEQAERLNKNVERGRATRAHVIEVATRLFAEHGYDGTSVEAVQAESGVSRGSLYHHFRGKDALFWAVLEGVSARVGQRLLEAERDAPDEVAALRIWCQEWIRLAGDQVFQQIVLIDAPAVLGWERWREIEHQHALGGLKLVMQAAADEGRIPPDLVDVFAHTVLAMVNELALLIARAPDQAAAQRIAEEAVDTILNRLLGTPAN